MYTKMRRLFNKMAPFLGVAAFALVIVILNTHAAMADTGGITSTEGAISFSYAEGAIGSIIKFATGPVAEIIAILAVLTGAVAFAQGREVNEGLKTLGVIGICCGLLLGAGHMFASMQGAVL